MKINLNIYRLMFLSGALAIFSCVLIGQTKPATIDNPDTPIKPDAKTTYSDLVDLILPKTGSETRKSIPLTNIAGDYKDKVYEGHITVGYIQSAWVNNNNHKQLLLIINLGDGGQQELFIWGEMNILALFDVKDKPILLDAVDVQQDKFAFFSEQQPILKVSQKADAFLIANHHFNSGDSYMNLDLISVVNNRFKIIMSDIPTMEGDNHCGLNFEEKVSLKLTNNAQNTYKNITIDFKHIRNPDGEDCDKKAKGYTKTRFYYYAWNDKRRKYIRLKGKK